MGGLRDKAVLLPLCTAAKGVPSAAGHKPGAPHRLAVPGAPHRLAVPGAPNWCSATHSALNWCAGLGLWARRCSSWCAHGWPSNRARRGCSARARGLHPAATPPKDRTPPASRAAKPGCCGWRAWQRGASQHPLKEAQRRGRRGGSGHRRNGKSGNRHDKFARTAVGAQSGDERCAAKAVPSWPEPCLSSLHPIHLPQHPRCTIESPPLA